MRRAARRDAAEPAIVEALRAVGAFVLRGHDVDLIAAWRGRWHMLEVKSSDAAKRRKTATAEKQEALRQLAERCGCTIHVVTSVDEALAAVGAT